MNRDAGEEPVAAAMVEVQMGVDDEVHACDEVAREHRRRAPLLVEIGRRVDHARVDEHEPFGAIDRVHEDGERPGRGLDGRGEMRLDHRHRLSRWRRLQPSDRS
jgi:hypothetical protein